MRKQERGVNKTVVVWILGGLATVSPLAIDLYLPAFADIAKDFSTTPAKISLSVSSYFIGMALGQILYGPLLDRFGRKKPLYLGLTIFIISSIACMLSTSAEALVMVRFIQALGGSVAWVGAVAMVRDFFSVKESARIFSLLILILGVSPLLAPTAGSFIAVAMGWQSVFVVLSVLAFIVMIVVYLYLPVGHQPDPSISLKAKPMLATFYSILKHPQFYTYTFSGAFSFATLFIYVAGSPVIFMEIYQVSPTIYGGIFALLSIGLIGGSQVNIFLTRRYSSEHIFRTSLIIQVFASFMFLILAYNNVTGLYSTIAFFFVCLSCIGLINPNANALALAPFTKNVGTASSLLGFTQLGIAALASSGVGLFDSQNSIPITALMAITSFLAMAILLIGRKMIGNETVIASGAGGNVMH